MRDGAVEASGAVEALLKLGGSFDTRRCGVAELRCDELRQLYLLAAKYSFGK